MKIFYGTFKFQSQYRDNWVRLECNTINQANDLMELHYLGEWSMVYEEKRFESVYFSKGQLEIIRLHEPIHSI